MNLDIIIEKVIGDVSVPIGLDKDNFQVRADGVLLNGKLHFWEEILFVQITNREIIDKLRKNKKEAE